MAIKEPREVKSGTTPLKARISKLRGIRRGSERKVSPLFGVGGCWAYTVILKYLETKKIQGTYMY
jgi:hypothetical protein